MIIVGTRSVDRFCEGEKGASGRAAFNDGRRSAALMGKVLVVVDQPASIGAVPLA
ncbi:hypothetical protein RKE30_16255 [Streptomyces sp. Li-HN-5-11]|uniref:hypothetical protein n=1 Tax=Streptomyces sp. Li-HN-5-11 TaxID=3075432 RepID=UPI0028A89536|nr:hypothetical protein [Streptomyces sp. Li-HN-5-11]WNM31848.1 hypothetical protein RKE30_16255 [Streptomyces sp. Li-HN-5-11]